MNVFYFSRLALAFFSIGLSLSFSGLSQEENEEANATINSNRKYKNEAGIDIAPFQVVLGGASAGYPSLFYRRHFIKSTEVKLAPGIKIASYHAYRFRVGSNLSFENLEVPDIKTNWTGPFTYGTYYYNRNLSGTSSFFLRLGKEKQLRWRRFELFYGYDFFFQYNRYYDYYLYLQNFNFALPDAYSINQDWTYRETTYSFGAAPIGGFKYFLIPRLCFSAEATCNVSYFQQTKTHQSRYYDNSSQVYNEQTVTLSTDGVRLGIHPLYIVTIGYYF